MGERLRVPLLGKFQLSKPVIKNRIDWHLRVKIVNSSADASETCRIIKFN